LSHQKSGEGLARGGASPALKACLSRAMDESRSLIGRWTAGVLEVLRQQESWAVGPAQRADFSRAVQQLSQARDSFADRWVQAWSDAVTEALRHPGQTGAPKRSLDSISFDELELMDDFQIQATVQVARLEQAVQGAAGDALTELSALLSRAQGLSANRPEHNPLRPDVAIKALRITMESTTRDKAVRALWLTHGTELLGQELQVLYQTLIGVLLQLGIKPADYKVVHAPVAATVSRSGSGGHHRPPGLAEVHHAAPQQVLDVGGDAGASGFLTLDHLHDLLVSGAGTLPQPSAGQVPPPPPPAAVPMIDFPATYLPPAAEASKRRGAQPNTKAVDASTSPEAGSPLQALASEVVTLMLTGMAQDARLLPPVRGVLQQLQPALLRIARDEPRFFVDRQNPARKLLDEITHRSLGFSQESAPGFAAFRARLEDLVPLLARTDVRLGSLFETALDVVAAADTGPDEQGAQNLEKGRAVAHLMQAEQRFLVADRVAKELSLRRDFELADKAVRKFLKGPWAQVIAQAQLEPDRGTEKAGAKADGKVDVKARMPADMRYLGVVSDLIWSSRVDAARRNRARLARVIPGMLRTLREGLQTIGYNGAASSQFISTLMGLHAQALRSEPDGEVAHRALGDARLDPAADPTGNAAEHAGSFVDSGSGSDAQRPWVKPSEAEDSGFMDSEYPASGGSSAVKRKGVRVDVLLLDDELPIDEVPELEMGAWVDLARVSGEWVRLQLAWKSPHGLMYLFGSQGGRTSSMSRRAFEDLYRSSRIKLVAANSVVDDALSQVLDVATRNSARQPAPEGHTTVYPDLLPPLS